MILFVQAATVSFVTGAVAFGAAVIALFFASFWRRTGDRFFALFALAFLVYAANSVLLMLERNYGHETLSAFGVRLASFVLILVAILDKNRTARRRP